MNTCLHFELSEASQKAINVTIAAAGVILTTVVLQESALAQNIFEMREVAPPEYGEELVDCAVGALFRLIEGSFGALVMVVAGLGAIISAAMGAYRATIGMLVVALGSFVLRALVSLFFNSDQFITCG